MEVLYPVCCALDVHQASVTACLRSPGDGPQRLIEERATGVEVRPAVEMREGWRRIDPPGLGEHTAEILGKVGVDASQLEELRRAGVV